MEEDHALTVDSSTATVLKTTDEGIHMVMARRARTALAVVRLVNGLLGLFAPMVLLRRLGFDESAGRAGVYPFRMFGIRTIVLGVDLLLLDGDERRRATQVAVLIHASDTVSAATAGLTGALPRKAAVMTTALSAGNTVLAVLSLGE